MNIITDNIDITDEEPMLRTKSEPDVPTIEEEIQDARDFHDNWSKSNPYKVWGNTTINITD